MQTQDRPSPQDGHPQDSACAVIIPFPRRAPIVRQSLGSRILSSFAFAASCLYPEVVVSLLALNDTVACKVVLSRSMPPENEVA